MTSFLALAFFIPLSLVVQNGMAAPQEVTHEDIRAAILSLATLFRNNVDKLERHEFRERQLGEQLKKALAGLDKRQKNQEQHVEKTANLVQELHERIVSMESMIKQRDERERIQLQKSQDAVQEVKDTVDKLFKEIGGSTKGASASYTVQGSDREYIEALQEKLSSRISNLTLTVEKLEATLIPKGVKPQVSIEEFGVHRDAKTEKWLKNLEEQQTTLQALLVLSEETAKDVHKLPKRSDVEEINNSTQDFLQEMKEKLIAMGDRNVERLGMKLEDSMTIVGNNHKDMVKIMEDIQSGSETLYEDIFKSYDTLQKEIKGLSKVEEVMVQTADNVLDTKRRIEYGVHQILLEVGDLIKLQGKNLNGTVNQRFDDIESTILDNQTGALTNLSSKIETEISQVWRQIGIMYQQLTASADVLDRLQEQTDAYVNGSARTMDSMEGKVEMITTRMSEVDDNLNYLLGKLSLVTSEFNQIKSGLATALDNIRSSFLEVQNEIKDVGPGPRPIKTENEAPKEDPDFPKELTG